MPALSLYALGPPRLERSGSPVELERRRLVALLTYLALEPGTHSPASPSSPCSGRSETDGTPRPICAGRSRS